MKKLAVGFTLVTALLLGACGGEKAEKAESTEPAKAEETVEEGGYIKYRGAEWAGEHNGLKINVNSVSVAPDLAELSDNKDLAGKSAAIAWVTLENTTDKPVKFDMHGAQLITDDGYELENSAYVSGDYIDDVRPGTKKDGDIGFLLNEKTDPRAVREVTIIFRVGAAEEGTYEDVEAKIKLVAQ